MKVTLWVFAFIFIDLIVGRFAFANHSEAVVTLTFDDGDESQYQIAYPIMKEFGLRGVVYIPTDYVGMPWQMNINDYNMNGKFKYKSYMTWEQLSELQNSGLWEVAGHTATHENLEDASLKINHIEIESSAKALRQRGFGAPSFATPFGAYTDGTLQEVSKYYESHRGYWDRDELNDLHMRNDLLLTNKAVESNVPLTQIISWIDEAVAEKKWLILTFHILSDYVEATGDYEFTLKTSDFRQIVVYLAKLQKEHKLKIKTIKDVIDTSGPNLFADYFSEDSWRLKWQTRRGDAADCWAISSSGHGAYPEFHYALKYFCPGNGTLMSKPWPNVSKKSFAVKGFVNRLGAKKTNVNILIEKILKNGLKETELLARIKDDDEPSFRFDIVHMPQNNVLYWRILLNIERTGSTIEESAGKPPTPIYFDQIEVTSDRMK